MKEEEEEEPWPAHRPEKKVKNQKVPTLTSEWWWWDTGLMVFGDKHKHMSSQVEQFSLHHFLMFFSVFAHYLWWLFSWWLNPKSGRWKWKSDFSILQLFPKRSLVCGSHKFVFHMFLTSCRVAICFSFWSFILQAWDRRGEGVDGGRVTVGQQRTQQGHGEVRETNKNHTI